MRQCSRLGKMRNGGWIIKYEQGIEQGNKQAALRMIEAGKLSYEEIAMYSGLTLEQVLELQKEVQLV